MCRELGERQQQVAHVALRVDRYNRNMIERGFLENADAEPGLAGTCHTYDHGMCCQVLRVIQNEIVAQAISGAVVSLAKIKGAEFFEVEHDPVLLLWVGVA